jgi:AcrR family transcriptional regulator
MGRNVDTRASILAAAARIVETRGAGHLTIDAVAQEAALSKGGVLYHFPTKRALLEGMLECLLELNAARTSALREAHRSSVNPVLRAYVLGEGERSGAERAMARSILAAAAEDPGLVAPARQDVQRAFAEAGEATDPQALGWAVLLALEGLRFLEMLNLLPLSSSERQRVRDVLLKLAEESPR